MLVFPFVRISARTNIHTEKSPHVDPIFYTFPHVNWMKIIITYYCDVKFSSETYEKLKELDEVQHWHIQEINKAYRGRSQLSMTHALKKNTLNKNIR